MVDKEGQLVSEVVFGNVFVGEKLEYDYELVNDAPHPIKYRIHIQKGILLIFIYC
jgi:hypothetical protein